MSELNQLQSSLARIFREALPASTSWENAKAVKKLQAINQALDGLSPEPPAASIAIVVAEYRRSGSAANYRDLKCVCYGAALPMPDGWYVLGNEELRDKLLAEVEQLDETRRRFKCFQALLSSYFAFALYDEQTPETAKAGWKTLRDWLARQRTQFQHEGNKLRLPGWFAVLTEHENLLTATPCDRYGRELLRGDGTSIEDARKGLGIPSDSWVMQEVILSQMKEAVELRDNPFKDHLDRLLEIVQGQSSVAVSELLKRRATAMLVSRYARCAGKPEQPVLRDVAVSIIGNPWLKRTAWDASVIKSDGQPDDEAREMVNGWLKRQLITDFFAVLSEYGQVNQGRLRYWLRFEPAIEDLWLVLGPDAMRNMSKPYQDLRERAKGRLLDLVNPGSSNNNAFIMRMGDHLIVEFGLTGNACYVYSLKSAPFSLTGKGVSIGGLKNKLLGSSHSHVAGWEMAFDKAICPRVGYQPRAIDVIYYSAWRWEMFSIPTEDSRDVGGAFWVLTQKDLHPSVDQNLDSLGFKYKENRGWWKQ